MFGCVGRVVHSKLHHIGRRDRPPGASYGRAFSLPKARSVCSQIMSSVRIDDLTKPSRTWDHSDERDGARVAWAGDAFLCDEAFRFIASRQHVPIAIWFSSDCTEHRHKHSSLSALGNVLAVRPMRTKDELIVQRWLCYDSDRRVTCLVPPPYLMRDTTMWTHVEAQRT